jgi:hypothetical protein
LCAAQRSVKFAATFSMGGSSDGAGGSKSGSVAGRSAEAQRWLGWRTIGWQTIGWRWLEPRRRGTV